MKYLLIAIVAALLFIPFPGAMPLFAPWETELAAAARELLANGRLVAAQNPPAYDIFPLFTWIQAASMALFGVTDFAARLPNAIIGIISLATLYAIGKKQADSNLGIWWALVYAGSWMPHLLFRSGLTGPLHNYFVFLAVYFTYRIGYTVRPLRMAAISGLCLGLAVLTQGPMAMLLSLLTILVYWVVNKGKISIRPGHIGLQLLTACLPVAFWLVYMGFTAGWAWAGNFCAYQARILPETLLRSSFYYWTLLPGCFPASIFLFSYLERRRQRSVYAAPQPLDVKDLSVWMWSMFWVVLLVSPSTLYYLPLSFLAARQVYRIAEGRLTLKGWNTVLLLLTGIVLGIGLILLPLLGVYKDVLSAYVKAPLIPAYLMADVAWGLWEIIYGLLYILLVTVSCTLLFRKKYQEGLFLLFLGTMIFIAVTFLHFGPKVEEHTKKKAAEAKPLVISKAVALTNG